MWERAFDDLHRHFARLAALVQAEFNVGWSSGGTADDDWDYPLHWWAEFSSSSSRPVTAVGRYTVAEALSAVSDGSASDKSEITIRADFVHDAGTLRYSSGITAGSQVPVAGPAGVIDAPHGLMGCYRETKAAVRDIGLFIEGSGNVIRDHLRERL